jgi:hypothetical protein
MLHIHVTYCIIILHVTPSSGAGVGLLAKLESVNLAEIAPLAGFAMLGSALTARCVGVGVRV